MILQTYSESTEEERDAIYIYVQETLEAMLQSEAQMTKMIERAPDDAGVSMLYSRILKVRRAIDMLSAEYDAYEMDRGKLAPPTDSMIDKAFELSTRLAEIQQAQNRVDALLDISKQALDATRAVMTGELPPQGN